MVFLYWAVLIILIFAMGYATAWWVLRSEKLQEIARRQRVEQNLFGLHRQFKTILSHIPVAVSSKNEEGRYHLVNSEWCKMFGVAENDARGQQDSKLFQGAMGAKLVELDRELLLKRKPVKASFTFRNRSLVMVKVPVIAKEGKMESICGITADMTVAQQLKKQLDQQKALFNTLFDALPYPAFSQDREAKFIYCNKAFEEAFGVQQAQLVTKTWMEVTLLPEELRLQCLRESETLIREASSTSHELDLIFADGAQHACLYWASGFQLPGGGSGGLTGAFYDVAAQRQAEDALQTAGTDWTEVLGACPVAMTLFDLNGTVMSANAAFSQLVGSPVAQVMKGNLPDFLPESGGCRPFVEKLNAAGGVLREFKTSLMIASGDLHNVLVTACLVDIDSKSCLVVWYVDVHAVEEIQDAVSSTQLISELSAMLFDQSEPALLPSQDPQPESRASPKPRPAVALKQEPVVAEAPASEAAFRMEPEAVRAELKKLCRLLEDSDSLAEDYFSSVEKKFIDALGQELSDEVKSMISYFDYEGALTKLGKL